MATTSTMTRHPVVTLPTDDQVLLSRRFAAPRRLVYRACTEPELVKRWWTGGVGDATVVEIDLRIDGAWRYVMTLPDGSEVAFHGRFLEIVPEERVTYTEIAEQGQGLTAIKTLTLTDVPPDDGAGTVLTVLTQLRSRDDRDSYLGMMGDGFEAAADLLEAVCREVGSSDTTISKEPKDA